MLRKYCPFWVAALTLFVGCDFFSTRDILPKPSDIRVFQGLFKIGDSISFRVVESIREPGSKVDRAVLSRRRLVFTIEGDSLIAGDSFKIVSLRTYEEPTRELIEEARRCLRISQDGLELSGSPIGGGARFYPLKVGASPDTNSYFALPGIFTEGWQTKSSKGPLTFVRVLTNSMDTIAYQQHSEATWGIIETVSDSNLMLSSGEYRYGASGLLKAEMVWPNFDWREANASVPGKVDLHRRLERI